MKFRHTLQLLALAAATAFGEVTERMMAEESEQNLRRKLKEHAVSTVERFLWLFQSDKSKQQLPTTTNVKWNGRFLAPIPEELPDEEPVMDLVVIEDETEGQEDDSGRRRYKRRTRRTRKTHNKRMTKSTKSCKSIKSGSGLEVIRKNPKGSKSISDGQDEILCFRGSSQDVTDACALYNADCCDGYRACMWEGDEPRTICQGSCNGRFSCDFLAPNAYIGADSCVGYFACNRLNLNSQECEPVIVGDNSCRGIRPCNLICAESTNCKVEIGNNACSNDRACNLVSSRLAGVSSVVIGSYACSYDSSGSQCAYIGRSSLADVYVGDYACNGLRPCRNIGREADNAELIHIGEGACDGNRACPYTGQYLSGKEIVIEDQACSGYRSCQFLGRRASNVHVEEGICTGTFACLQFGLNAREEVTIGKEACETSLSCQQIGQRAPGSVSVGKKACSPRASCLAVGFFVDSGDVYIGKDACDMYQDQCSVFQDPSCYYTSFIPKDGTSCT